MKRAKLIVAASDSSADMLYATQFRAPDPFIFLETEGRKYLLLSDLEIDRGRKESSADVVLPYSGVEKLLQGGMSEKPPFAAVLAAFLRDQNVTRLDVPGDFPLGLARELKKEEIRLRPVKGHFFPERVRKKARELKLMEAALRSAEAGLERAMEILRATTTRKDGKLQWGRRVLTSEILRAEMEIALLRTGSEARSDTIVACGDQACDPHERGQGPLFANQLIILDIFPRSARSGYFGDISRTIVRGRASEEQRRLWHTCLKGQVMAIEAIKPGVAGGPIHDRIKAMFAKAGYPTEIRDGRWQGFFHGTGHGLGLEIHEEPRFSATTFTVGQVITVEPGIYMPGIGGVRHEDVIVVTPQNCRVLTKFPKTLEI